MEYFIKTETHSLRHRVIRLISNSEKHLNSFPCDTFIQKTKQNRNCSFRAQLGNSIVDGKHQHYERLFGFILLKWVLTTGSMFELLLQRCRMNVVGRLEWLKWKCCKWHDIIFIVSYPIHFHWHKRLIYNSFYISIFPFHLICFTKIRYHADMT